MIVDRHCEAIGRSRPSSTGCGDEAIQVTPPTGLLRSARNDETQARARIDAIARSWICTPFHDHGEVKGAGCDCATFLKCVFVEAGLIAPFEIGHYSPQFFLHSSEERYLGWVKKFGRRSWRTRRGRAISCFTRSGFASRMAH
jgi:hypothetical protein